MAGVVFPSGPVQLGIGITMSRGNDTTVALLWSAEMCSSMVTSFCPTPELPASSSLVSKAPPCPVRVSVPASSRLTSPSMAVTLSPVAPAAPGTWSR